MRKKSVILTLMLAFILAMPAAVIAKSMEDVPQRTEDGTVYVMLRMIAYVHSFDAEWDGATRTVTLIADDNRISFNVEEVGGFIEDGTSWVQYEFAVGLLTMVGTEELDETAQLIAALISSIEAGRLFVYENSQVFDITSTDGYVFGARLAMPPGEEAVRAIVIDTGTSGPNTYSMCRYFPGIGLVGFQDFWANEFINSGIAFFSANTRGVTPSGEVPDTMNIDEEGYLTYLPSNVVEDVYHMIRTAREHPRLADAQIFLYGHSEGAIIATLFEATHPRLADALFLAGMPVMNMYDIIHWQASGRAAMMHFGTMFEMDEYSRITREAFYAGPWDTEMGASFDELDLDGDGFFTAADLLAVWQLLGFPPHMWNAQVLIDAIERGDDEWLWDNYPVLLTTGWFREHFALRSNMELIPELDLPIYIFHGAMDAHVYVGYVRELEGKLAGLGRTNVTINIFEGHDHDLNSGLGLLMFLGLIPEGMQAVIDAVLAHAEVH